MRYKYFQILLLLSFTTSLATAQMIMENDKGEKIVVYPDGSWKYADQVKENANNKAKDTKFLSASCCRAARLCNE
jgi:hypothetical protein